MLDNATNSNVSVGDKWTLPIINDETLLRPFHRTERKLQAGRRRVVGSPIDASAPSRAGAQGAVRRLWSECPERSCGATPSPVSARMRAGKIRRRSCRSVFGSADQKCCGKRKSAAVVSYEISKTCWKRSLFIIAIRSSPTSPPMLMFRNCASNASCTIMSLLSGNSIVRSWPLYFILRARFANPISSVLARSSCGVVAWGCSNGPDCEFVEVARLSAEHPHGDSRYTCWSHYGVRLAAANPFRC